jgi:hypothetical protein
MPEGDGGWGMGDSVGTNGGTFFTIPYPLSPIPFSFPFPFPYSHSIVAGGLPEMS